MRGWDYPALVETYQRVTDLVRREHVPAVVHVTELTQPQGHSTSGSHERYKSRKRLQWEKEYDGLGKMRRWMIDNDIATADALDALEEEETADVRAGRDAAWRAYEDPIRDEAATVGALLNDAAAAAGAPARARVEALRDELARKQGSAPPGRRRGGPPSAGRRARRGRRRGRTARASGVEEQKPLNEERYHTHLYAEGDDSALRGAGRIRRSTPTTPRRWTASRC